MIFGKKWALLPVLAVALPSFAQTEASLGYRVEADVNVSAGEYAPMWMTSNRYGLASERPNSGWLRAGVTYDQPLKRNWRVGAGLDLAGTLNNGAVPDRARFVVQQAYAACQRVIQENSFPSSPLRFFRSFSRPVSSARQSATSSFRLIRSLTIR